METETTGQEQTQTTHEEPCPCKIIASHIMAAFGLTSETARNHVRNARIEMLKAARAVIDERISHLSRAAAKGTKVVVE
jgi:hypothetical protein